MEVDGKAGTLYAVGTGPSGADFLTVGAVRVLSGVGAVFYPRTAAGSRAFECVRSAVDVGGRECAAFDVPMTRDRGEVEAAYAHAAGLVCGALSRGVDAAVVTVGDVSLYSSAASVAEVVRSRGFRVVFVPGVSSVSAACAALSLDLAPADGGIRVVPGDSAFRSGEIAGILAEPGAKVFMKCARHLADVCAAVVDAGLSSRAHLVHEAGGPRQLVVDGRDFGRLPGRVLESPYFSIVIVK